MGFTNKEICMLKLYWDPCFNKSWIYLANELILENLTKDTSKDALQNFYKRILLNDDYIENIDYKNITYVEVIKSYSLFMKNDFLNAKPGNRKKYYIVSGECYKGLLLSLRTKSGKETRKYYIKVEGLANAMKDYMFACFQKQKEQEFQQKEEEKDQALQQNKKLTEYELAKIMGFTIFLKITIGTFSSFGFTTCNSYFYSHYTIYRIDTRYNNVETSTFNKEFPKVMFLSVGIIESLKFKGFLISLSYFDFK
jgi:phage anti-repressor protein